MTDSAPVDLPEPIASLVADAMAEAARRCGLAGPQDTWTRADLVAVDPLLAGQLPLALKALAFIALRGGDQAGASGPLDALRRLDPEDGSGASVVTALAESVRG